PLFAELRPQVAGKLVRVVDLGGDRRDLLGREAAHLRADLIECLAQTEVVIALCQSGHQLALVRRIVVLCDCRTISGTTQGHNTTVPRRGMTPRSGGPAVAEVA